jgi:hypothetical protein
MSISFKVENVDISAVRDRAMFNTFAGNQSYVIKGIGDELEITHSTSSFVVSIGTGEAVICGGSTLAEGTNELTLGENESGYIVIRVDLAQTGANICQFKAVPTLVQEEINNGGYIYDFELAQYTTNGTGVNTFRDKRALRGNITEDVVKSVNGVAPTNNNITLDYISTINSVRAKSDKNFVLGEGSNALFMTNGQPIVSETTYCISITNNAYEFTTNLLSVVKGLASDTFKANRSSHYNTYIKNTNSECADAPTHHKTEKATVYVVRDRAGISTSTLNATAIWVSLEKDGVMFERRIVNGAWSGNWKFVGSRDLLWTNPNPTDHFQPATISKDVNEYDNLLIIFKTDVDASNNAFNSTQIVATDGGQTLCQAIYPSTNSLMIATRLMLVYEKSEIRFSWDGWLWESPNFTRTRDNSLMVPLYIYGI